jgi:pimeloyl-ACP methyl ester carboxylesterase
MKGMAMSGQIIATNQTFSRRSVIGTLGTVAAASVLAACGALPPIPVPTATEVPQPTATTPVTPPTAAAATSKFVNNQGVRIHYEVEGKGPPLVLVHGHGSTGHPADLSMWRNFGYTTELGKDYQLILVDIRGHGQSDKPSGPEPLRPDALASDVIAALDDVGVAKAHYWGYSMGGMIGWCLATSAPTRFGSLIVGGSSPYGIHTEAQKTYYVTQVGAPLEFQKWPGVANQLSQITLPSLLYAGELDPFRDEMAASAKIMPNAAFVSFPGLDHPKTAQKSDLVLPYVTKLLAGVKI